MKLCFIVGRNRTLAGSQKAVERRLTLIRTYHAVLSRGLEKSLAKRHGRSTAAARHGMCELAFNSHDIFLHISAQNVGKGPPINVAQDRRTSKAINLVNKKEILRICYSWDQTAYSTQFHPPLVLVFIYCSLDAKTFSRRVVSMRDRIPVRCGLVDSTPT